VLLDPPWMSLIAHQDAGEGEMKLYEMMLFCWWQPSVLVWDSAAHYSTQPTSATAS